MQLIPLTDAHLPQLGAFTNLTDVRLRRVLEPRAGLYIAEGSKVLTRALAAGHQPHSVLLEEKWLPELSPLLAAHRDLPVYVGSAEQLETITGYQVHRGALAAMVRPTLPDLGELLATASRIVVIEDVVDHTNVGAMFRSVAALGADAVLVTARTADPLYRRSVKVSMGCVFQVPWCRIDSIPDAVPALHRAGFHLAALALAPGSVQLDAFAAGQHDRVALLLGTEGSGLRRQTLAVADSVVTIPMRAGVDSLNVAAAAAVALWELRVR